MPNTINHEAWTRLRVLLYNLDDQRLINKHIEEALKLKMKYTKLVVSRDKLRYLQHNRIGTTRIENLAREIEHHNSRNDKTVVYIVENHLKRIVSEIKELKHTVFIKDKIIHSEIKAHWRIQLYKELCEFVISPVWVREKENSRRSREFLYKKYKNNKNKEAFITVKEGAITVQIQQSMSEEARSKFISEQDDPVSMGITLDENEKAFLKLPQSLTNHSSFDRLKMLTDVALMGSKIRMTVKSRLDLGLTEEEVNNRPYSEKREEAIDTALLTRVYDPEAKIATFSNMRVTSMKTCRRVKIPDPLPEKEEAAIQSVITAVESAINREAQRNSKMRTKPSTLTKSEALGLKSLKKRTKKGEAAIVLTDKSGRLSVMSKQEYARKVGEHTGSDPILSDDDVQSLEQVLSATSSSMAKILKISETWNQQDRVQSAVKATNSSVPPLAILLKDHKPGSDKPVRPLCRSSESPNGPLSQITANVMNIIATELNNVTHTEVKSTEEMCSILDSVNSIIEADYSCLEQCGVVEQSLLANHMMVVHPEKIPAITIGSMDVKALYPSLDINHSCEIIKKLITNSTVKFDVNPVELALHIAATHTQDQINKLGISDIVHMRRYKYGPRPTIISKCVTGTQLERDTADSWLHPARPPTQDEETLLLAIAVSNSVKTVMTSHVYTNSNVIRLQQIGMAIGSTATAEVAKLLMLEHDQILWDRCASAGLTKIKSGRYVDDENPVLKPTPYGARLSEGKIIIQQEHIQSDTMIPHDKRTFSLVQQIANSIWPNIQFTVDIPSDNPSGLIPMLDMEVGINQVGHVIRRFYTKPMNTPFTILSRSAHSWQIKRATLTQEGVRRLLNTSQNAPSSIKTQIMSDWDLKMNRSGYDQSFRANVIQAAIKIYNHKILTELNGGRPMYRPAGWNAQERNTEKLVKRQTWYQGTGKERNLAPLIIDPTPSGQLEKEINNILKEASRLTGIRVKMCQRGGNKISSAAKSDPFASKLCDRLECPVCSSPESNGQCKHSNVGYQLICETCKEQGITATYEGETSKSGYERGIQHVTGLTKKAEDAPLWKHNELVHEGSADLPFSMVITGRFQKAMIRQESEAIRIRESQSEYQMNSKKEFQQPTIIRLIPTSNHIQADQEGNQTPIIERGQQSKRKNTASHRADSPNVPNRSVPNHHNNYTQQPLFVPVQSTRRERQDLQMHQAISRSVMRAHPSTVDNREYDRLHYRSPTVDRKSRHHPRQTRLRSVSPVQPNVQHTKRPTNHVSRKQSHSKNHVTPVENNSRSNQHNTHQSKTTSHATRVEHISNTKQTNRQHSNNRIPAQYVEKVSKPSYYVKNHSTSNHVQPSSSLSPNPIPSKKQKTTKTTSSVHGKASNNHINNHINHQHMELSGISDTALNVSPVSPMPEVPQPQKSPKQPHQTKPQSDTILSLSPVSPTRLTQYCLQPKTLSDSSVPSTVIMEDEDMFSQMSPSPLPQFSSNTPITNYVSPKSTNSNQYGSSTSSKSPSILHSPHSEIPNVFKCTKEKSLQCGEKSKHPISPTPSDDIPLLNCEQISLEELDSISDEFDKSWNDEPTIPTAKTSTKFNTPLNTCLPHLTPPPQTNSTSHHSFHIRSQC